MLGAVLGAPWRLQGGLDGDEGKPPPIDVAEEIKKLMSAREHDLRPEQCTLHVVAAVMLQKSFRCVDLHTHDSMDCPVGLVRVCVWGGGCSAAPPPPPTCFSQGVPSYQEDEHHKCNRQEAGSLDREEGVGGPYGRWVGWCGGFSLCPFRPC
jgi:hypothetical protein